MVIKPGPSAWAPDFMKESKSFVKQAVAIWSQQTLCPLNLLCLMLQSHQMMEKTSGPKLLWTTFLDACKHVSTFAFKLLKYQDKWRNNMKHILLNVVLCLCWLLNIVLLFVSFRFTGWPDFSHQPATHQMSWLLPPFFARSPWQKRCSNGWRFSCEGGKKETVWFGLWLWRLKEKASDWEDQPQGHLVWHGDNLS